MKKMLVLLSCLALVGAVGCKKKVTPKKQQKAKAKAPKKGKEKILAAALVPKGKKVDGNTQCKIHMDVSGMSCPNGCVPVIKEALQGVKGLTKAVISFKDKKASVDGKGFVCDGKSTQPAINKAFAKKHYACKVSKIDFLAKATKKAKDAKGAPAKGAPVKAKPAKGKASKTKTKKT